MNTYKHFNFEQFIIVTCSKYDLGIRIHFQKFRIEFRGIVVVNVNHNGRPDEIDFNNKFIQKYFILFNIVKLRKITLNFKALEI